MTYFAVITKIPDGYEGNYACSEAYINPDANKNTVGSNIIVSPPNFDVGLFGQAVMSKSNTIDLTKKQIVFCNTPVFKLGEILIMDSSNDRTIPDGRKPGKWVVEYETFHSLGLAIKKAIEVTK